MFCTGTLFQSLLCWYNDIFCIELYCIAKPPFAWPTDKAWPTDEMGEILVLWQINVAINLLAFL